MLVSLPYWLPFGDPSFTQTASSQPPSFLGAIKSNLPIEQSWTLFKSRSMCLEPETPLVWTLIRKHPSSPLPTNFAHISTR